MFRWNANLMLRERFWNIPQSCADVHLQRFATVVFASCLNQQRFSYWYSQGDQRTTHTAATEGLGNYTTLTSRMVWCWERHPISAYHCGKIIYSDINKLKKTRTIVYFVLWNLNIPLSEKVARPLFSVFKGFSEQRVKVPERQHPSLTFVKSWDHQHDSRHTGGGRLVSAQRRWVEGGNTERTEIPLQKERDGILSCRIINLQSPEDLAGFFGKWLCGAPRMAGPWSHPDFQLQWKFSCPGTGWKLSFPISRHPIDLLHVKRIG